MAEKLIKRGWREITSGKIYEMYLEVADYARELKLWSAKDVPPLYTHKSIRSFGTCYCERNKGVIRIAIVLNEMLLGFSDDQIREILVHEFAHAIRPFEGHSLSWKVAAYRIGRKWGYEDIERYCNDDELNEAINKLRDAKRNYKYEVFCPTCGKSWKYEKETHTVKFPQSYKCNTCHTPLKSRAIQPPPTDKK